MTAFQIPAGLAEYATARGYAGAPIIVQVAGSGPWYAPVLESGQVPTPEILIALRERGIKRVVVGWRDPVVTADFTLHELLPWTGLRGNPASFPVDIETEME